MRLKGCLEWITALLFLVIFSGWVLNVPAFSETVSSGVTTEKDELDEAKEKKGESSSSKTHSLDEITVTATKTTTPKELLPVSAFSVGREEIESQPNHYMSNFGELIRDLPGVHVAQYYPWGPPWVHLRGTGYFIGRTVFLVDGIPVTPFISSTINNNDIERVDVLLGPSSALYGANASGGAVNVITRSGYQQKGVEANLGYGSYDTWRPHVSAGDRKGNFHYYISYSGDYSDGYHMKPLEGMIDLYKRGKTQYLWDASYEKNRYDYHFAMGKLGWENEEGIGFVAAYNYANLYLYGGQKNLILNDHGEQGISSFKLYAPLGDRIKVKVYGGYQHFDRPGTEIKGLSLVNGVLKQDSTPTIRSEWDTDRYPVELQVDVSLLQNNILTAGAFWSREKEIRETYQISTDVLTSKTDYTTDQTAFYLQDQFFLLDNRLSLLAGIRYDRWKFHDIFDMASSPQEPESIDKDHVSYRGGARYKINDMFSLKASAGTAFWPGTALWFFRNVRTGKTWREANPNLSPEKTWMVDFGGEFTLFEGGTSLSATGYYGEINDMVSYRYDVNPDVPGGTIIRSLNLGKAEIYGVEFMVQQKITKELSIFGSLTLNHSRLKESGQNTGNQLRNAPDYWGSLGVRYINPELVNCQATLRFSDDRYYDDENTDLPFFHMKAYQTVDFKVWRDWKLTDKIILNTALSMNNLFDEDYATEIVYVNPGRTFQVDVGVRYAF